MRKIRLTRFGERAVALAALAVVLGCWVLGTWVLGPS